MLIIVLLVLLAIATGVLGAVIKGAFWLFIIAVLFLVAAYFVNRGRATARR